MNVTRRELLGTVPAAMAGTWALAGRGIVLRSIWEAAPLIERGELCRVLPDAIQPANIWAVYPERVAASAKVRVCVDFLVEALAGLNAAASDDAG